MDKMQTPQTCIQGSLHSSFFIHGSHCSGVYVALSTLQAWLPVLPVSKMPRCCPTCAFTLLSPLSLPSPVASSSEMLFLIPSPELIFPTYDPVFQPGPATPAASPAVSSSVGHESGCSLRQGPVGRSLHRSLWHRLKESMFTE